MVYLPAPINLAHPFSVILHVFPFNQRAQALDLGIDHGGTGTISEKITLENAAP